MVTSVPGPPQDSSQSPTATAWGKCRLNLPLHPALRWWTVANRTFGSSPPRAARVSCSWWALPHYSTGASVGQTSSNLKAVPCYNLWGLMLEMGVGLGSRCDPTPEFLTRTMRGGSKAVRYTELIHRPLSVCSQCVCVCVWPHLHLVLRSGLIWSQVASTKYRCKRVRNILSPQ